MKFQIPNMHHSEVNGRTHTQTDTQTSRKQNAQLFQSWGHNKHGLKIDICVFLQILSHKSHENEKLT